MKFFILTFTVLLLTLLYQNLAQAYCLVSSSTTYTEASLPYQLNKNYNGKGTEATCGTKTGQLDFQSGYDQGIYFINSTWWSGYDKVDVKTIVLKFPLTLNNSVKNLVIGNWANVLPDPDSEFKNFAWDYPDFFDPTTNEGVGEKEYGVVTIDGSKLKSGVLPIQCASGTSLVALRNLIIITNGVAEKDLWEQSNNDAAADAEAADAEDPTQCLRDGGNVVVQTVNPAAGLSCAEQIAAGDKDTVCASDQCKDDAACKTDVSPPICLVDSNCGRVTPDTRVDKKVKKEADPWQKAGELKKFDSFPKRLHKWREPKPKP